VAGVKRALPLVLSALLAPLALAGCEDPPPAPPAKTAAATPTPPPAPAVTEREEKKKEPPPKKKAEDCPEGNKVSFDDSAFEAEVRRKLPKPAGDITKADLARLRSLYISQIFI
jgi:hypothetical protein